jgi:phage-related protein
VRDPELSLDPEEIRGMARAVADALASQPSQVPESSLARASLRAEEIDLEAISSSALGITDILGQISAWFRDLLNSVSSWIVSSVQGFVNSTVMPAVRGISDWLSKTLPDIGQSLAGIPTFISQRISPALGSVASYLSVTLPSYFSGITDFFTKTLPGYFSGVSDFFTKTIPSLLSGVQSAVGSITGAVSSFLARDLPSYLSGVSDFFTKTLPNLLSSVTNFFTRTLPSYFSVITDFFTRTVPPLFTGVTDFFTRTLPSLFSVVTDFFTRALPSLFGPITDFFTRTLPSLFSPVLDFFTKTLPSLFGSVVDFFSKTIPSLFSPLIDFFTKTIPSLFAPVVDFFTKTVPSLAAPVIDFFTKTVPSLFSPVVDFFTKTVPSLFSPIVDFFTKTIPSLAAPVIDFFTKTLPSLFGPLIDFFTKTVPAFFAPVVDFFTKTVPSLFAPLIDFFTKTIPGFFTSVWDFFTKTVPGFFASVADFFTKTLPAFFSGITDFFTKTLPTYIGSISDFFTKTLPGLFKGVSDGIQNFVSLLANLPTRAPELVLGIAQAVYTNLIKPMYEGIKTFIIDPVQSAMKEISKGMGSFSLTFQGFANALANLPTWFKEYLVAPLTDWFEENFLVKVKDHEPVYTTDPEVVVAYPKDYYASSPLARAIPVLPDLKVFSDPFKWLMEKVIAPFSGWLGQVGGKIWEGLNWLWGAVVSTFQGIAKAVWDAVTGFASWLWDSVTKAFQSMGQTLLGGVMGILSSIGEALVKGLKTIAQGLEKVATLGADVIGGTLTSIASTVFSPIYGAFATQFRNQVKGITEKFTKHSTPEEDIQYLFEGMGLIVAEVIGAHYMGFGVSQALHALASFCDELRPTPQVLLEGEGGCALEPLGLGARLRSLLGFVLSLGWHIKPSYLFREMAKDVRELSDGFTRGLMYGLTIWSTNPIVRLMNVAMRDALVIELPTLDMMQEIVRRHMPRKEFADVLEDYRTILKLYGYRTSIIDWLTSKDLMIEVTDRFGTKRTVPISLLYELPSASDVATMMVRDIFASLDDFQRLYSARGMHPDVGALYYFLRFRYPPPERLWQFTVRGISGLLWTTLPDAEKSDVEKEVRSIGALMPVAPVSMNFQADTLMTAFKTYMKWHDYFRGAWIQGFTSDNLIYIDTLAEVPTKIEQRWMVKWGIYELLSAKKVTYQSPVRDFASKVLEDASASGITMDLTNFSRTVLGTGLHPDWVPVTAVAEAMNALTEERTALRAGFMGLFKEGFYGLGALETLLSGFIKASFQVAYFDMAGLQWRTGWVNMPVAYLPPERKLIELRSLMDRSLDILREVQRDLSNAYQEFIVWDYNEYKSRLSSVISEVNGFYASDYEKITGARLPDELKLAFVEDYYRPYVNALKVWRDVFTVRRIRMWTQRWLGWVMYRVAYAGVRREDFQALATYVSERAKLTPEEKDFIQSVMEIMYGIARRGVQEEYMPTPSTMATLSEYMTLPLDLVQKALADRGLQEPWLGIWLTYVRVRPIKADARALLSTYVRAFRYGAVTKEALDAYVKSLPNFGFTPVEIDLISRSVDLEAQILEAREYVPTPMTLATLCEYLPEARQFYEDVARARRIPKEWHELWARYIDIRPLVDDIKRYVSRAEDLYVRFMTKREDFEKVLKEASGFLGYTPKELEFLEKVTEFERYSNAWRELIGSVERLVSLSEYSPRASSYALGKLYAMIDALPLPDAEKRDLKTMWEEYIRCRPVKEEAKLYVTQLINLYVDGLISDADFRRELQEMSKWGFSKDELMFYEAQAVLRRARKLRIPVGE